MKSFNTYKFILILLFIAFQDASANNKINKGKNKLQFLPFVNISISPEIYQKNKLDYNWQLNREIYIDIFHYKNSIATFSLLEEHIFGGQTNKKHEPSRIHYYPLEFISLKLITNYGVFGISLDHECYNIIDHEKVEPLMYRWYGAALTWQTQNMLPNNKFDHQLPSGFNFINTPAFYIYIGRSLDTVEYNYDYIFKMHAKYCAFNFYSSIYYVSCKLYLPLSTKEKRAVLNRQIEIGSDILTENLAINPYFKYSYQHDLDIYKGKKSHFWSAGLNFEKPIDFLPGDTNKNSSQLKPHKYLLTDLNFTGQYARFFLSDFVGYLADISIILRILELKNFSANFESILAHSSMSGASDLFPRYLEYSYKSDLRYNFKSLFHSINFFHKYTQFHEGNFYKGYYERFHLLGLDFYSNGMNSNHRFNFSPDLFNFFNIFNYRLSAARVIKKSYFKYSWIFSQEARINYYNSKSSVLYLKPKLETLYRKKHSSKSYNIETGITLFPGLAFELYYKFGKFTNIDKIDGAKEYLHMIGLRLFN